MVNIPFKKISYHTMRVAALAKIGRLYGSAILKKLFSIPYAFHMQTTGITVLNMFFDVCVSSRTLSYQLEFMSTVYTANLDLHIFCLHISCIFRFSTQGLKSTNETKELV